jgi:hypothetical protein
MTVDAKGATLERYFAPGVTERPGADRSATARGLRRLTAGIVLAAG